MIDWDKVSVQCGKIKHALTLGTSKINENEIQIYVWCKEASLCELCLYEEGKCKKISMYPYRQEERGGLFSLCVRGERIASLLQGVEYDFKADGKYFTDPYARVVSGRDRFGRKSQRVRGCFDFEEYDWEGEEWTTIPTDEIVLYQCHVRGFTRHASSKVKHPGTFSALAEKIPYLKELGVTALLCLPVYDFDERMKDTNGDEIDKINYWGYGGETAYFAPKRSYAADVDNSNREFQQLVKELHRQGMNIYLDMYFENKSPDFIVQCLRYYALRFHIDGFRINQECMDTAWLADDPVLSHVRLIGLNWADRDVPVGEERLLQMNDRFLIDARKYLKSDEGQTECFYYHFKEQRRGVANVHYITQHNGFTLQDMISYDVKHNEANGEKNLDGTEYNYSWNCGVEGPSRKKEIVIRRKKQEKNAFVMLLLGMAVPMLLAGDEFGNSQKGNNNAYCQDNEITWLDWRLLEKNKDTFLFVKNLLLFRKEHPLYHNRRLLTGMDGSGLGVPDVSCHGREPWQVRFTNYSREMAVLYFGKYYGGKSLYFAFNLHWEAHDFYLPDIKEGNAWRVFIDTAGGKKGTLADKKYLMKPRSITVFECVEEPLAAKKRKDASV